MGGGINTKLKTIFLIIRMRMSRRMNAVTNSTFPISIAIEVVGFIIHISKTKK